MNNYKNYLVLALSLLGANSYSNPYRQAVLSDNTNQLYRCIREKARGINEQKTDRFCETALHVATKLRDEKKAQILLKAGADRFTQNNRGQTPLHTATQRDAATILIPLISGSLPPDFDIYKFVNHQDKFGNTALHYAAGSGFDYICALLLNYGNANPLIANKRGQTPWQIVSRTLKEHQMKHTIPGKALLSTARALLAATRSAENLKGNPYSVLEHEGYE